MQDRNRKPEASARDSRHEELLFLSLAHASGFLFRSEIQPHGGGVPEGVARRLVEIAIAVNYFFSNSASMTSSSPPPPAAAPAVSGSGAPASA